MAVLNRVIEATADISTVEVTANMEGKRMVMVLSPRAGVVRRHHDQQAAAKPPAAKPAEGGAPAPAPVAKPPAEEKPPGAAPASEPRT
jgi:hypothetical protein